MPQVHFVKKARKDNKEHEIKKGDSYYWWAFMRGGKYYSKTHPKKSQLTRSSFFSELYSIQENIESWKPEEIKKEDMEGMIEDIISSFEDLKSNTEESLSNMPESLQQGPTGELLQERIDGVDEIISELQSINLDEESTVEDIIGQIQEAADNYSGG